MKRPLNFPNFPTVALILFSGLLLVLDSAYAAPYCLLRKPYYPPQPNCFEFYLADTAVAGAGLMAVSMGGVCSVTAYAARQRWEIDPRFGGSHPNWVTGDLAMHAASPYHLDAYGCHAGGGTAGGGAGGGGAGGMPGPAADLGSACETVEQIYQPELRYGAGRIAQRAIIHGMSCTGAGGSREPVFIYEYPDPPTAFASSAHLTGIISSVERSCRPLSKLRPPPRVGRER